MFTPVHGTAVVMLGVQGGVLVAADKRQGNTLSVIVTDEVVKILPIHPVGLVTGWGLARLVDDVTGEVRVDLFRMFRRLCRWPSFQFQVDDFHRVGNAWFALMEDHLARCDVRDWPGTPECGFWFKALVVFQRSGRVEAWQLELLYRKALPRPELNYTIDSVQDRYVNGGGLLVEGDQRGTERLAQAAEHSPFLPETHQAWTTGIEPATTPVALGARIVKDALYASHLSSAKPDGERGVGTTCDIAFIDRTVGFRWYERDASTIPDRR